MNAYVVAFYYVKTSLWLRILRSKKRDENWILFYLFGCCLFISKLNGGPSGKIFINIQINNWNLSPN